MNNKLLQLAERREGLVAQIAAQRTLLAQNMAPWHTPLALADQGLSALRFIRSHPAWMLGGGLFAVLRPGSIWKWVSRGWLTWQLVHKLRKS